MSNKKSHSIGYHDQIAQLYADSELAKQGKQLVYNITFQVTDRCSLCCTYCYQHNKGTHVMDFETAKKFIDLLLNPDPITVEWCDSRNSIAAIIEFIGGEPLLEIELIDQISDYFIEQCIAQDHPWQYNYMFDICSNGVAYFNPKVQEYLNKYKSHLSFSVSIDGNKELHDSCRVFPDGSGSYDIAMAAVRDWVDNKGGKMGSKMTLAPQNIIYTKDAVIGLIEAQYDEINLNCVFEKGWTEEHATILYHQLIELADYLLTNNLDDDIYISMFQDTIGRPKLLTDDQTWCGGNGKNSMLALDWKGDIFPCIRYMESSLGTDIEPVKIGDVEHGIGNTAKCQQCIHQLRNIDRFTKSTLECLECPIAEGCADCAAYNYEDAGGKFNQKATYICVMHKARVLANCYYWNMLYHKNNENKRFKLWLSDEEALKIITLEELEFLKALQYPLE